MTSAIGLATPSCATGPVTRPPEGVRCCPLSGAHREGRGGGSQPRGAGLQGGEVRPRGDRPDQPLGLCADPQEEAARVGDEAAGEREEGEAEAHIDKPPPSRILPS